MSQRQRSAHVQVRRARVARAKELRRRARSRRAGTAALAAVTLAVGAAAGPVQPASSAAASAAAAAEWPLPPCSTPDSDPMDLTDVDGRLFFTADDGTGDRGLWRADNTGTTAVRILEFPYNYGSQGRYDDHGYRGLTDVGGTLFFITKTDRTDALWRSDGTRGGTVRIKRFDDLDSRGGEGGPSNMAAVGDTLFFTANGSGGELWKSDGTTSGTVLVKAIPSHAMHEDYTFGPSNLTTVGDRLFFTADDGTGNEELWTSDGSADGTVLVKDIYPGNDEHEGPGRLTALGDTVYFTADDGVHGRELWTSDGTAAGTVMVEDTVPGEESGAPSTLTAFGGTLFFGVSDPTDGSRDLWTSDGTAAGTALVKDFQVDGDDRGYRLPRIVVVDDRMFFFTGASGGVELWTSDGTEAGTMLVKGVPLGYNSGGPGELTAVGDTLYFYIGGYSVAGTDLWRSDGTEAGTSVIEHIDSPTYGGPGGLTASGGKLFFAVDDSAHGNELWVSDGTGPGTHLVRDIDPSVMFVSRAARTGAANATARVPVTVYSSGTIKVAPARMGGVRKLRQELVFDGNWYWDVANLTLDLTRAAKRELRRTGRVEIGARFTYTSCAGPIETEKRTYTLKKRR